MGFYSSSVDSSEGLNLYLAWITLNKTRNVFRPSVGNTFESQSKLLTPEDFLYSWPVN